MEITLQSGLPEEHRPAAARLYWEAFGGKLGRVMGPEPRALAYLDRVMRSDHVITAMAGDQLVGLAGFKTPSGAFASGNWRDMRMVYGRMGALWRLALLGALQSEVDNDRFLIDGIAVTRDARGGGIGTALLGALCDEGCARGYASIRLEVIDSNWRAKALYEREGFTALHTEKLGLLRHLFGFESATTMVRVL